MATIRKVNRKTGEAYQICFTNPNTKKTMRKIVWCSKQDALKMKKEIEANIAFGRFNLSKANEHEYSWKELTNKYEGYSKRNKTNKTVIREKIVFKAFEEYTGGNIKLTDITNEVIEKFKIYRLRKVKKATVSIEIRVLKTVFNQAIIWKMLEKNPTKGVTLPKDDIIKVRFLNKKEIDKLLEVIDDYNFKRLVISYLLTGARRTEILEPKFSWENVNFEEKRILLNGKGSLKRYIPMNDTLFHVLSDLKKEGANPPFKFKPDFVTHKIQTYYSKANIKGANLHSLRKTFGSILLQEKLADIYIISRLLGHSSIKTTEKYYVDLVDDNYRKSVDGLDNLISI